MRIKLKANAADEIAGGTGPFPEGEYTLAVTGVEDKETQTGRNMVKMELTVETGSQKGRKMWHNLTFIPEGDKGHGFTVRALHALGLKFDGNLDFDTQEFVGRAFKANVGIEDREWNGKTYHNNIIREFLVDAEATPF
jgi:hypothetical protein